MSIKINLGAWNSIFAVPSSVVDNGLKFADGVKLKVLLCVLRNSGKEQSAEEISACTGVNVTDIPEALDYWVDMGVLQKTSDDYILPPSDSVSSSESDLRKKDFTAETESKKYTTAEDISNDVETQKNRFTVTRPQKPDYFFTAQRLAVDEELKILVGEAQSALGKTLSNSDISTLLMLKDTCGLTVDVILMLIQYCVSIDKANMRTVEKIGVGWADEGINSIESADEKIRRIKQMNANFSVVSASFGLSNTGSPTKKQLEYSHKWVEEWKFSPQMLREAYERCVDSKGTMKFNYIDGILKRWQSAGIKNLDELYEYEKSPKKKTGRTSSYDIDELEKINTLDDF